MQGQARQQYQHLLDLRHEGAAGASIYVGSKHAVEGITKSVALEIAKSGIRGERRGAGLRTLAWLTRFTGTPENKAALGGRVFQWSPRPLGGACQPRLSSIGVERSFVHHGHILNVDGGHTAG